jgi:peptide/nickel transport system substrate-binding protein
MGIVSGSIVPSSAFGFSQYAQPRAFDLDRARELLAEAGVGNFSLTLMVNDELERVEVSQIVQAQLLQIGIDVDLRVMEFGTFLDTTSEGAHDLGMFVWTIPTLDADYNYFAIKHSSQHGAPGNRTFLEDPEVDRLIELGRQLTNPAERQAVYDELTLLLHELSPNAYLFGAWMNTGVNNRVQGFVMDPNLYHRLYTVWVE